MTDDELKLTLTEQQRNEQANIVRNLAVELQKAQQRIAELEKAATGKGK